jgi:lipopolysaccharide heptosyltransferase II
MNADVMRKIDRFVGIPLCFLLTRVRRIVRLFRPEVIPRTPPQNILFIEMAEIGAFVVAYPAMEYARRKYPDAQIYFLTFSRGPEIIRLMGAVPEDNIIVIRPDGPFTFIRDTIRAILRLRQLGIDATVNLEVFARYSTIVAFFSGASRRAGFYPFHDKGGYVGDLVTHKVLYSPHVHAVASYLSLVESLSETPDGEPLTKKDLSREDLSLPRIETSPLNQKNIQQKLKDLYPALSDDNQLVLLNPNAGDMVAARRWPDEHFVKLGKMLLENPDILIVLTGSPDERPRTERLAAQMNSERVLNMAGRTTLWELIDLYNQARLLVTNDSGPAHFASLTDIPVLVLFGPETPRIFGPLGKNAEAVYLGFACSPCVSAYNQKKSPCRDNRCLQEISPNEIYQRAGKYLDLNYSTANHEVSS